jgi:hypothetical protein
MPDQNLDLYPEDFPDTLNTDLTVEQTLILHAWRIRRLQSFRIQGGAIELSALISGQNLNVYTSNERLPSLPQMISENNILAGEEGDRLLQEKRYLSLQESQVGTATTILEMQSTIAQMSQEISDLRTLIYEITGSAIDN